MTLKQLIQIFLNILRHFLVNTYNWDGIEETSGAWFYWKYFGTINEVDGRYYVWDYVRPEEIPSAWLKYDNPKKFLYWLNSHGEYIKDEKLYQLPDHWESPAEFIKKKLKGDCDGFALAWVSWCVAKGLECRLILGNYSKDYDKKYKYNHLSCLLWYNNVWYYADPTNAHFIQAKYFDKFIPYMSFYKNKMFSHE